MKIPLARRSLTLALLLVLVSLGCNLAPAPSVVPGATTTPTVGSPTQAPTPTPPPTEHRIAVRYVNGLGEFYERQTGERFVPRGFNYARLDHDVGYGKGWHSTFDPALYRPDAVEQTFARLEADGYNTVRVFIDCCSKPGQQVGSRTQGINMAYVEKVVDFLQRGLAHHVYVLVILDLTPGEGNYNDPLWKAMGPNFGGEGNVRYLTKGGLQAKTHYVQDFIRKLIELHAPFDAIFAYDLTNELSFESDQPPLSLTSGLVTTANGGTYDMSSAAEKARMVDEGTIYWIDSLRATILALDPTALVTTSFFVPQGPVPTRLGDPRLTSTKAVIEASQADFIDVHLYPRMGPPLPDYARNFGVSAKTKKPVIMGEFGAAIDGYSTAAIAAGVLRDWQIQSCQFGFDGWLVWTWDTEETYKFWNALSQDGAIEKALAPVNRPDPCRP